MTADNHTAEDQRYMDLALNLAARGVGHTGPNPTVGCVIVQTSDENKERLVGWGATAPGGRPHAETVAIAKAGNETKGATAYVTLEPCAHHGKTAPCAEALVAASVRRVVVALEDCDPRVSGKGIATLKKAGIDVDVGVGAERAQQINKAFFTRVLQNRPRITLKIASTLDGKIATRSGSSQWITGEASRRAGHMLRARLDAILVGIATAVADDPMLTCRLHGLEDRSPTRVVLDTHLKLSPTSALVRSAQEVPTWVITSAEADTGRRAALSQAGCEVYTVAKNQDGHIDLRAALTTLAQQGISSILVEGGAEVAASCIRAQLVDELVWFRAPLIMGGDGLSATGDLGFDMIDELRPLNRVSMVPVGDDVMEMYEVER